MGGVLFPTSVIGSLPRPQFVKDLIADDCPIQGDEYRRLMGEAIRTAVAMQETAGLDYVSDDYVAFRIDLANAQLKAMEKLRKSPVANQTPSQTPIDKATIDRTVLASCFQAIRDAAEKRGQQTDDLRVIAEASLKDDLFLESLVRRGVFARDT